MTGRSHPARPSGVVVVALVLAGALLFAMRHGPALAEALRLALPDTDDAMRLVEVRDFLSGQSWWDMTQHRLGAPPGTPMHWSRLVDVPLAVLIGGLGALVGRAAAEAWVVALWPPALFLVYLAIVGVGMARLFGRLAAGAAVFAAGGMVVFGDLFAPGRIDHHNVQVLLVTGATLALGCASTRRPWQPAGGEADDRRWGIACGVLCGLSLAVGLETLPTVATIGGAMALLWACGGEGRAAAAGRFGLALAATSALAFAAQTAPGRWMLPVCDALSPPWLLLAVCGGLLITAAAGASHRMPTRSVRVGAFLAGAILLAAATAFVFPQCLAGPYAIVPEPYRSLWSSRIPETFPFQRYMHVDADSAHQAIGPLWVAAVLATAGAAQRGAPAILRLLAALLVTGAMLPAMQIRTVYVSSAFVPLAAGWFAQALADGWPLRPRWASAVGAVAGLGLLGMSWAGAQALRDAAGGRTDHAPSPTRADRPAEPPCSDPQALARLASLPSATVLAPPELGSPILLHTPHRIVTAGYHRDPAGIIAGIEAFSGAEADMRAVVQGSGVDLVAICKTARYGQKSYAARLAAGATAEWLGPLTEGSAGPLMIWRVKRPE